MFEPIKIVRLITEQIGKPRNDGTRGSGLYIVPFELSTQPSAFWAEAFLANMKNPPQWSSSHRPDMARLSGKIIYLDGTTVEEIERTHKETLLLAVKEANEVTAKYEADQARVAEETKKREEEEQRRTRSCQANHVRVVEGLLNNKSPCIEPTKAECRGLFCGLDCRDAKEFRTALH